MGLLLPNRRFVQQDRQNAVIQSAATRSGRGGGRPPSRRIVEDFRGKDELGTRLCNFRLAGRDVGTDRGKITVHLDHPMIRLSHYDPRWRQEFEQTRSSLFFSGDGWMSAVHHVGSTAISGLIARATIDAIAVVDDIDAQETAANLIEGLNFRRVLPPMWAADAIRLVKPRHIEDGQVATHDILVTLSDSPTLTRCLAVRDYLTAHRDEAMRFEETKVARWQSGEGDPEQYEKDKRVFFARLEEAAGL